MDRLSNLAPLVATIGLVGLLIACSGPAAEERPAASPAVQQEQADAKRVERAAEVRRERTGVVNELQDIRADIDRKLAEVNKELENGKLKKEIRKEKEEWRDNLEDQRKDVDQAIDNVQGSTDDTWDEVKAGTRNTIDAVGDWFKKQAENIDKETKADADKDGH